MNDRMNEMRFDTHDRLNRKDQATKISNVLKHSENYTRSGEGLVVALNSPWGTGKTMFLKMWENEIKNATLENEFPLVDSKTNVLYYNSWDNDDFDNALIPLIDCFNNAFKSVLLKDSLKSSTKNSINKAAKKFKLLALKSAAIIGKNLIKKKLGSGIIDDFNEILDLKDNDFMKYIKIGEWLDDKGLKLEDLKLEEQKKAFEKEFGDSAKESYEKIKKAMDLSVSKEFEALKTLKKDFRETLEILSKEQKLVVFLDELDRCRPLYAIETLEAIKHFFSVPNVVFVLSVDIEQLSHSIATVYGQNMDAEGYLMRFVDMQFKLPTPKIEDYCYYLNNKNDKERFNESQLQIIVNIFRYLNLSIRDMEKMFINIKIFCDSLGEDVSKNDQFFSFYCFMSVLKYKDLKKYRDVMQKKFNEVTNSNLFENQEIYEIIRPLQDGNNVKFIKELIERKSLADYIEANDSEISNRMLDEIKKNLHCFKYIKESEVKKVDTYYLTFAQYVERIIEFVSGH